LAKKYASRTWFVHLRSCNILPNGDFTEAPHLGGRADIISLVRTFETIKPGLPMRVDHAPLMLGDDKMGYNAGYSFHGRMLALGQVEGVMATVDREIKEGKLN
jgi:mannonate dehydratase